MLQVLGVLTGTMELIHHLLRPELPSGSIALLLQFPSGMKFCRALGFFSSENKVASLLLSVLMC